MPSPPPRIVEQLYRVPLKAFTSERNAKVAELRKVGGAGEARAVQRLAKPSATLWATNQLARLDPNRLAHFIEAIDRIRRSQLRNPRAANEAMQAERTDLEALLQQAGTAMTEAGYRASTSSRSRISNTLLGAAADRQHAHDLRRGRLMQELPAPGFEILAGAKAGGQLRLVTGRPGPKDDEGAESRALEQARRAVADERRRREAEELGREAARRDEELRRLASEADELKRKSADVQERLRVARRVAKNARSAARQDRTIRRSASPRGPDVR